MKGHDHGIPSTVFPDDHNLAILGHELGNVLNGLLGMVELLGDSGLTADQGRWLRAIEYSGRQMESLIRSGWFSRKVNQPVCVPHRSRVDGMEILEQVVTSHTPAACSKNNRLFLVAKPELSRYWLLDACLTRQLLDNLVGNAIKFTRSGEIVIEAASVVVDGKSGGAVRFRVSDTGPGFDAAAAEQIFGAYHRGNDSGEAETGNRGLGLYICRSIARAMRGQITCSSPEGGGAHFEVVLPGALCIEETSSSMLRSSLLEQFRCQLRLGGALKRSIANFLARLGVRYSDQEVASPGPGLALLISEAPRQRVKDPPSLLFTLNAHSGMALNNRILEAPLLESNLGAILLEIALEWRSLVLRNENPGSIPRPR
ncbi:MAG: HAMP domain-containing histidine kinase [Xanthomonadales bacterium]|nr:HAMP domain-containing histidine kinase [Xanthomonadales bacterium]